MKMTDYAPGTPSWVDLGSPDPDASKVFYAALFGWESQPAPPEAGGYTIFHLRGGPVAAVGPLLSPGGPATWMWYATSADADGTARRVEAAGGKVLMAPMNVTGAGRMAVFLDATGAPFSVWQPGRGAGAFIGAHLVNEPGTFAWNELTTRDTGGAMEFYAEALDWTAVVSDSLEMPYVEFQSGGRSVAGMVAGEDAPVDSRWLIYFAVRDCDATVARCRELGGSVSVPATDLPGTGRYAICADDLGARFAVIRLEELVS
jgi:predicted enzyme related to lactoylglutathione lyase